MRSFSVVNAPYRPKYRYIFRISTMLLEHSSSCITCSILTCYFFCSHKFNASILRLRLYLMNAYESFTMQDHCRKRLFSMNTDILFPPLQRAATKVPAGECERNWRRTRRHHAALLGTTVGQGQTTILSEGAQCRQRSLQGINWHASTRFVRSHLTKDSTLFRSSVALLICNTWLQCCLAGSLSR